MKRIAALGLSVLLISGFTGCSRTPTDNESDSEPKSTVISSVSEAQSFSSNTEIENNTPSVDTSSETTSAENSETDAQNACRVSIPQEITEIPDGYFSPAAAQGTLADLYYETYESFSYEEKTQPLEKHAVVYLPSGYDENKRYNVFYLMHGGWGNENQVLGTPSSPSRFKNVIDNAIANGDFEPLIIVCPTYNNTSPEDSANFSLALNLNRNYHNELINDLIPAVESKYSTYAESASTEDLTASHFHRGFGGFSMGSVATWRTFQNCLDYFCYFLPMSCGTTLDDENIFSAAKGREQSDYFVFTMTGTEDFAYGYVNNRVDKMRNSPYFTEEKNFAYRIKEGYDHGGMSSVEYTYNGLCSFWK